MPLPNPPLSPNTAKRNSYSSYRQLLLIHVLYSCEVRKDNYTLILTFLKFPPSDKRPEIAIHIHVHSPQPPLLILFPSPILINRAVQRSGPGPRWGWGLPLRNPHIYAGRVRGSEGPFVQSYFQARAANPHIWWSVQSYFQAIPDSPIPSISSSTACPRSSLRSALHCLVNDKSSP